jgi:hypothetical protein
MQLVSLRLGKQADKTLKSVNIADIMTGQNDKLKEVMETWRAGRHWVNIAKYTVLSFLVFIRKLLHDSLIHSICLVNHPV